LEKVNPLVCFGERKLFYNYRRIGYFFLLFLDVKKFPSRASNRIFIKDIEVDQLKELN